MPYLPPELSEDIVPEDPALSASSLCICWNTGPLRAEGPSSRGCCRKLDSGHGLAFPPIQLHWQQRGEFVLYLADFCMDLSAGSGLGGVAGSGIALSTPMFTGLM